MHSSMARLVCTQEWPWPGPLLNDHVAALGGGRIAWQLAGTQAGTWACYKAITWVTRMVPSAFLSLWNSSISFRGYSQITSLCDTHTRQSSMALAGTSVDPSVVGDLIILLFGPHVGQQASQKWGGGVSMEGASQQGVECAAPLRLCRDSSTMMQPLHHNQVLQTSNPLQGPCITWRETDMLQPQMANITQPSGTNHQHYKM